MSVTPEAVGNITGVRAIFSALIAVGREIFTALGTNECVDSLAAHLMLMSIPPTLPAGGRTELLSFFARCLFDGLSATFASIRPFTCRAVARKSAALTIGFDGTDRHTKNFCYTAITTVFMPQSFYFYFLFSGHKGFLQSERKCPLTIPLDRFEISGRKKHQKKPDKDSPGIEVKAVIYL